MAELNDRITSLIGIDMAEAVERLRGLSLAYDMARARADHLADRRKAVLAEATLEALARTERETGRPCAHNRAEAEALASIAYRNHLDESRAAQELVATTGAEYFALKAALDVASRQLSFAQAELRLQ